MKYDLYRLIARLRNHAEDWKVTSDTPDEEVLNETNMARDCSRAADAIEELLKK